MAIVLAFAATYRGSGVDDEKAALLRRLRKVVIIIAYVVGLGGFAHIIAGSVEVLYLVTTGALSWGGYFARFFARHSPETSSGGGAAGGDPESRTGDGGERSGLSSP